MNHRPLIQQLASVLRVSVRGYGRHNVPKSKRRQLCSKGWLRRGKVTHRGMVALREAGAVRDA